MGRARGSVRGAGDEVRALKATALCAVLLGGVTALILVPLLVPPSVFFTLVALALIAMLWWVCYELVE
jgi:hypothetical protein